MPIGAFRLNTLAAAMASGGGGGNNITATGGTITYYSESSTVYKVHTFPTGTNNFVVSSVSGTVPVDILVVGGGGAAGGSGASGGRGGGGGAGGYKYQTGITVTPTTYSIVVGAGGAGVSGTPGIAGGASSGLGYSVNGGGGGGSNSAPTGTFGSGGGGGGNFGVGTTSGAAGTAGQGNTGGNGFGSSGSASFCVGGGGGGSGGAGGNGQTVSPYAGGTFGAGTTNTVDGTSVSYARGGGGGGATVNNNANTPGSGGNGSTASGVSQTGASGTAGTVIVRYPTTRPTIFYFVSVHSVLGTINLPPDVVDGDYAFLIDRGQTSTATAPASVTPSGWTSIVSTFVNDAGNVSQRVNVSYKKLVAGDASTTITGMNPGTTSKTIHIYRSIDLPNISIGTVNSQTVTTAPTNQTLSMSGSSAPFVGFAIGASTSNIGTTQPASTVTPSRDLTSIATTRIRTKMFEANQSGVTFSNSTISMTDLGTNSLITFVASFS
jgi:hypothetical protein